VLGRGICVPGMSLDSSERKNLLRRSIFRFDRWLEQHGYPTHDPYDIWGSPLALKARELYYKKSPLGLPAILPFVAIDFAIPSVRALITQKERYATADAQLALAFANLYELEKDPSQLGKATRLAKELLGFSVGGYRGYCWGYAFDWRHVNGVSPKNTPFITTTPYCFEAFVRLHDLTGEAEYLRWAESVAEFVAYDLKDTPFGPDSAAGSYSPFDDSKVVNASAYRAMVLFEAGKRFSCETYSAKAEGNLRFILQSQRADGSWLYSADNPREAFIDHFHTCFVLKNLCKIYAVVPGPEVRKCIERGFSYYRRALFSENGRPKSFAVAPRFQLVQLDMYNYAEAITLGSVIAPLIPEALAMAEGLAEELCLKFQLPDGHFVTRVYKGGIRHTFPFLRWPQAQLFLALTNLLKTLTRDTQDSGGRISHGNTVARVK
jgi:hypothetical protein